MRGRTAALALGLLLLAAPALVGEEAAAQTTVCGAAPTSGQRIECHVAAGGTGDITIAHSGLALTVTPARVHAINLNYLGASGRIGVTLSDSSVTATGADSRGITAHHRGAGGIAVDLSNVDVRAVHEGVYIWLNPSPGREGALGDARVLVRDGSTIRTPRTALSVSSRAKGKVDIDLIGAELATTAGTHTSEAVVYASKVGGGDLEIDVRGGSVKSTQTNAAYGIYAYMQGAARAGAPTEYESGDIRVTARDAEVETLGYGAIGVFAEQGATGRGHVTIDVRGGSVKTGGESADGVYGHNAAAAAGLNANVRVENVEITTGSASAGGALMGGGADGVYAGRAGGDGNVSLVVIGGSIRAENWHGIQARHTRRGDIAVSVSGGAAVSTGGTTGNMGVFARHSGAEGRVSVSLDDASLRTAGTNAYGVLGWGSSRSGKIDLAFDLDDAFIRTAGANAYGVYGVNYGLGRVDVDMTDGVIRTAGANGRGVFAYAFNAANEADVSIAIAGGAVVSAEGAGARGLYGQHSGLGSVSVSTGARSVVRAPFSVGADGWLDHGANAAGRLVFRHAGTIEARDAGIRAHASRTSGSTFQDSRTADDAARTEPMIHVSSSGDVAAGEGVMDDFIRSRVAGIDGRLSAGEQAVLSAITAEDSDALDAALGALPASYTDDYRAEARDLLRRRAGSPDTDSSLAIRAAEKILGLFRAGVRALAISYSEIAHYVRRGDRDPAILAVPSSSRTAEQAAALAEQEKLSAAESAALEAVLTGGDLEGALAVLPAAYSDSWKDGVRHRTGRYNAGGIRVDVTGGAIASGGNGVEALYAVPHERNGAIAVTVARGASVAGGASGVYVGNAGAGDGNFRAQSVSIDGRVEGGTVAGVYMRGGGRLAVGVGGRVGASSGVGVLADGPGDFTAAIDGVVEGDVRALGAGDHAVTVAPGAAVTGTIHLAASEVRADGTVGAVRFERGGMVTAGRGGVLTGAGGTTIRGGGAALTVDLNPSGRRFHSAVRGAVVIHNAGGKTTILVNGVKLHDAETGETGARARNGPRIVYLLAGAGEDEIFTAEEFIERGLYQGIYEALPGMLLRMESGRTRSARKTAPASPVWARLSGGRGSRGPKGSDAGAKYDFASFGTEAGLAVSFPWTKGLAGSASLRYRKGTARVSIPDDRGEIDLVGLGAAVDLSWKGRRRWRAGWHARGGFSVMEYAADVASREWGKLKHNVDATVRVLDVEAGRIVAFNEDITLTARGWLTRSEISMGSFTDAYGERFRLARANRLVGGGGFVVHTARPLEVGGGRLVLRGSADVEEILSGNGGKTTVEVSGERFRARTEGPRLLLSLGARWRRGRVTIGGEGYASGLGSGDETFGGRLNMGAKF